MKKIIFIIGILSLSYLTINAQTASNHLIVSQNKEIDKVIKIFGWQLPQKEKLPMAEENQSNFSGVIITQSTYSSGHDFKNDIVTTLEIYSLNPKNDLTIINLKVRIDEIIFYSIDEKVFAMYVTYTRYHPNFYVSGLIYKCFSDEDGDGKIETGYGTRFSKGKVFEFPEWVKEKAKKKTEN